MARIHILDDVTINKIAAGEVIENPASVVKELVENAIDSGASEISIETKAGGRQLIKVSDNGCGMGGDDLLLSIERHATSKLKEAGELSHVQTLGFRGEALPSIASVSKMTLHSAPHAEEGRLLTVSGGKIGKIAPQPRRQGTTIEVKELFFNVPVRKNFQKSLNWDTGEIHKVLTHFALCYPTLAFSWVHDMQPQFSFLGSDPDQERIKTLLGKEFTVSLPVEHHKAEKKLSLEGWIAPPDTHRPNRTGHHLFINGRSVTSPFIARKVLEGYGTHLPTHRYPLFVLHLTLPAEWVDVNVHPQKKEVRLREEEEIGPFIFEAISRALQTGPRPSLPNPAVIFPPPSSDYEDFFEKPLLVSEPPYDYLTEERELFKSDIQIVAKVHPYYFIQEGDGVRIVHTGRALERVVYDSLTEKPGKRAVQALLLPIHMHIGGKERYLVTEHLNPLNELGIAIRHFGGDSFVIDAIPAVLEAHEIPDLILSYLSEGALPHDLSRCLKRGSLGIEAAKILMEKLFRSTNPDFTPNGKRIHTLLDEKYLDKTFG